MTESSPSSGRKVLVIDDELSIVTYLSAVLEDEGYATCSASDAEQALTVAREQHPDLITLDIMMPRRSGIALYRDIRLDPELCHVPVIFVSAFSRNSDFPMAAFRKIVPDERIPVPEAYAEKPIEVVAFVEKVKSLIGPVAADAPPDREAPA